MKRFLLILILLFSFVFPAKADDDIIQGKIYPSELGVVQKVNYVDLNEDSEVAQVKQTA